jgi:hypothetical protein
LANSPNPVFNPQARDPLKLTDVVGHNDQSRAAGMRANQHLVRPGRLAQALQLHSDLAETNRRFGGKRQDVQSRGELLDRLTILGRTGRLLTP